MSLTHYFLNDYSSPFDRFVDDFRAYRQGQQSDLFRPRMDVHQDENTKTVTATFDLPGMRKDDVAINVHNNVLNVSGEMKETTERKEEGYTHRERRYGKFSRSLTLPQGTKKEDVKASMANGVLDITFPSSIREAEPSIITISDKEEAATKKSSD